MAKHTRLDPRVTVDRKNRSGHFQGKNHSEVYRDGKVYVYTAWDDNAPEVGTTMPFEQWLATYER